RAPGLARNDGSANPGSQCVRPFAGCDGRWQWRAPDKSRDAAPGSGSRGQRSLSRSADLRCRPGDIPDSQNHAASPAARRTRPFWASYRPRSLCVLSWPGAATEYLRPGRIGLLFRGQSVVNIFSRAAIFDDAGPFQLGEMTRDARLAHPENFLELGHGKLVFLEKKNEPEPGRIGQELEKING